MSRTETNDAFRDRVVHVIATEVAPMLEMDGNDVEVLGVEDGVVRVRLLGACGGCPGSVYAVVMGVEEELRRRVPEVRYLEVAL